LRLGVGRDAVEPFGVRGDGAAQLRLAVGGGVLVVAAAQGSDEGVLQLVRSVGVREPGGEVERAVTCSPGGDVRGGGGAKGGDAGGGTEGHGSSCFFEPHQVGL